MAIAESCAGCGLTYNCVCFQLPQLSIDAHIALLMHENELRRETNTGQWLLKSLPNCSKHIWQRKSPCPELVKLLANKKFQPVLLFPDEDSVPMSQFCRQVTEECKTPLFIILDGTWQESSKMIRKSPWLEEVPRAHIIPCRRSEYQLRRNQSEGHLCTFEVATEVVRNLGEERQAESMAKFLTHYMQIYQADKSGHRYRK